MTSFRLKQIVLTPDDRFGRIEATPNRATLQTYYVVVCIARDGSMVETERLKAWQLRPLIW